MMSPKKLNDWVADKLADGFTSMIMFWFISALIGAVVILSRPHTLLDWVQFLDQTAFQGMALPILGFVTKKAGSRQEKLLIETHNTVMSEFKFMRQHCKCHITAEKTSENFSKKKGE